MKRMRWIGAAVVGGIVVGVLTGVALAAPPAHPSEVAVAGGRSVAVGNATRVVTPAGTPAPVASAGQLLLDERASVGEVSAGTSVRARLLAEVHGPVLVAGGSAQLGPQAHVAGDLVTRTGVVVGLEAAVDGALVATEGPVRLNRLARVAGDVYARTEFKGDRDVVVGAPGTTLEIVGKGQIRDRGEYFATILHEGPLAFVGVGDPILHGAVVAMGAGSLGVPSMPAFALAAAALPAVQPGTAPLEAGRDGTPLGIVPGRYGRLVIPQDGVAVLGPGLYEFESIQAQSYARLVVDAGPAPAVVDVRVRRDVQLGKAFAVQVVGADRFDAAARMVMRAGGSLRVDSDAIVAGTLHATKAVVLGKHVALVGSVWSPGDVQVGRDSTVVWVPAAAAW